MRCSISNVRPVTAQKGEGGLGDRLVAGRAPSRRRSAQDVGSVLALRPDAVRLHPPAMPQTRRITPHFGDNNEVYAVSA